MGKRICALILFFIISVNLNACTTNRREDGLKDNESKLETTDDGMDKNASQGDYDLSQDGIIKPKIAKELIEEIAEETIYALSIKDAEAISQSVHPVKGLRFTPYTYVSTENDLVFNKGSMENFFKDDQVYLWGFYDGIGDEIKLSPDQYYDEFIYSEDFINAEAVGYNEILTRGNMIENQFEVYERPIVVEYYFSGFNPEYSGMDWRSLRLVFEEYEDDWKLVGIIHNQWTI